MKKHKETYFHSWNVINLSILIIGWIMIYDAYFIDVGNAVKWFSGVVICIISTVGIYLQNDYGKSRILRTRRKKHDL